MSSGNSARPDGPPPRACIFSAGGVRLDDADKRLFAKADPLGFILFARNIETPAGLRALCGELRACVGWHCPILIDQEGGRVARLKDPDFPLWPSAAAYGRGAAADRQDGLSKITRDMGDMAGLLASLGVDVNCAPVCDLGAPDADGAIGDRAYGEDPALVSACASAVCSGFLAAGVRPVIKHMPGHGRARVDSHFALPRVNTPLPELRETDFAVFQELSRDFGQKIWGMSAHVVYNGIDSAFPATLSPEIVREVIRKDIGFRGFLVSDDLEMKALSAWGGIAERAARALEAGMDAVLYCGGDLTEMASLAESVPRMTDQAMERAQAA